MDPRWQRKRLEIFERDGWACRWCGDKHSELHAHHLAYNGLPPWEVADELIITLCHKCHESAHRRRGFAPLAEIVQGLDLHGYFQFDGFRWHCACGCGETKTRSEFRKGGK